MARLGASISLDAAFRRLRGVEAQLDTNSSGVASLAAMASAEAKLLAFVYGIRSESESVEGGADEDEDDPLTVRFLAAIDAYSERINPIEQ